MQVIPQSYIRQALADLRLWFFDLLIWIAQFVELPRDVRLFMQGELRTARSELRHLLAYAAMTEQPHRRTRNRSRPPRSLAQGYRFQRRMPRFQRVWTRGVKLRTRADIRATLENFDKVVMRLRVQFHAPMRAGTVVMVCARNVRLITNAPAPAAESADTS